MSLALVRQWREQAAQIMKLAQSGKTFEKAQTLLVCADELHTEIKKRAAQGGKKSRRKLTKKEARRIAKVRWAAGQGGVS